MRSPDDRCWAVQALELRSCLAGLLRLALGAVDRRRAGIFLGRLFSQAQFSPWGPCPPCLRSIRPATTIKARRFLGATAFEQCKKGPPRTGAPWWNRPGMGLLATTQDLEPGLSLGTSVQPCEGPRLRRNCRYR